MSKTTPAKKTAKTGARTSIEAIPESTRFEDAMAELETIVQQLESDEQPLEEALLQFEKGVNLVRFCQQNLAGAEQKIRILSGETNPELQDFDTEEESSSGR